MIRGAEVIGEEEQLVLLDRTADAAAEIVVMNSGHCGIEEIAGVKITVLNVLIGGTVELVAPGLQNDVGNGPGAASQVHGVVAGGNVHRVDGVQRRDQD